MLLAAVLVRLLLFLAPGVGGPGLIGVHVHHLLSGVLLMAFGGIPALMTGPEGVLRSASVATFGFGAGLALDEWVLFVLRESSPETAYMDAASAMGSAALVGMACLYAALFRHWLSGRSRRPSEREPRT